MNHRFVFESFEDFLKNLNPINEKKKPGTELDLSGATELVDKIIELDIDLAEKVLQLPDASGTPKTYGLKAIEALRSEEYGKAALYVLLGESSTISADEVDAFKAIGLDTNSYSKMKTDQKRAKVKELAAKIESMSDDEAMKLAEAGLKALKAKLPFKYRTPLLWGMLSDADKAKVYDDFFKLAIKRGYDEVEGLDEIINKSFKAKEKQKSSSLTNPGIFVFLTKEEIKEVAPSAPVKPVKTFLLDDEKAANVFVPNKTGANGQPDFMKETFNELVEKLGSVFQRYKAGEITTIKKINILTSADRYRNTEDAENLSWGELSYSRSIAMTKLIEGVAQAVELDDDIISQLPKVTSIYFKGENGDGTSGPNPPEGKKFGYYVKNGDKSQWVEGKSRDIVTIIPVDDQGLPTATNSNGAEELKESPKSSAADYNKFRYNNIEIEFEMVEIKPGVEEPPTSEKIVALKYPVKIQIPSRYSTNSIKIPIPSITTSYSSSGKNSKPGQCPSFLETTKTKYGLTFKTINVLTYKSDLTNKLF